MKLQVGEQSLDFVVEETGHFQNFIWCTPRRHYAERLKNSRENSILLEEFSIVSLFSGCGDATQSVGRPDWGCETRVTRLPGPMALAIGTNGPLGR
ncbi:MAG TPA: hypothetical protein PK992_06905, partial [Planctomycetaceae bacterium]|nr:hypothetical protein [Planctomycetaceae bacterium]HRA87777.1 hypothetical protein [Planctomycetaceae bacterium]